MATATKILNWFKARGKAWQAALAAEEEEEEEEKKKKKKKATHLQTKLDDEDTALAAVKLDPSVVVGDVKVTVPDAVNKGAFLCLFLF